MSELRLMAVHAHPDDESSKGAATLARYADEGHRVLVVTLTGGERGEILNPAMDLPDVHGRIAEIRRDEMTKRPRSSVSSTPGWASSTPGYLRVIYRHRCLMTASRGYRWRCPPRRWCGWFASFGRT